MQTMPDLSQFDWIVVNSSGGKDSQTALREILHQCLLQDYPRSKVVVSHQCLGKYEWPGTLDLVRLQCAIYGVRLVVTSYRDKHGTASSLLDYVRARGKWPSSDTRFCTSEFKRGPGGRVLTQLAKELAVPRAGVARILNVFGFRADESPARAKRLVFVKNVRHSSSTKEVWDFLPIHHWTEQEVWDDILQSCVPYHPAYDSGMQRLSCVFCIFAPYNALLNAAWLQPDLLMEYVDTELSTGHDFQHNKPLRAVHAAMLRGEVPGQDTDIWKM